MDQNDRQAIDGLFGKLSQVEQQSGQRDNEAEALIRERVAAQPASPYFMAQTIVVQDQALQAAQQRIEQLEYEAANRPASGGLLSSLFGGGSRPAPQPQRQAYQQGQAYQGQNAGNGMGGFPNGAPMGQQAGGPWGQQAGMAQRGGGGFLAGAAQTAMGVAGGVLLGNAIAGMFAGDTANAAPAAEQPQEDTSNQDNDLGADAGMDDMDF
ncbi:DUF2076 domain-containing protein [Rhizobium sp. LjRoot30]|uniref:DUF2076 domain-containing protein n=1 Tax=Rhizobium sp. LjRoot30 TaxID=3342320 RepID=UPI003ECF5186